MMTSIQWTEETWNPLAGCTRKSEGCDNCYAAAMSLRLEAMAKSDIANGRDPGVKRKYIGVATKTRSGVAAFNGTINTDEDALSKPLAWKRPRMIFVNSMSDLFHENVPVDFIHKAMEVMHSANWHTYQVLTKRPDRMLAYQQRYWPNGFPASMWAMTSVENQNLADERIPLLLQVNAKVRGLSVEPLLAPVGLTHYLVYDGDNEFSFKSDGGQGWGFDDYSGGFGNESCPPDVYDPQPSIHWVIVGGESGPNARPCDAWWIKEVVNQCHRTCTPVFVKQMGARPYVSSLGDSFRWTHTAWDKDEIGRYRIKLMDKKGGDMSEWPADLQVRQFPRLEEGS